MSPYTSLVAVEKDDREREKKEIIRVDVLLMVPEGYESSVPPLPVQMPYPSLQSMATIPDDPLDAGYLEMCAGSGTGLTGLSFSMDTLCEECEPECMAPEAPPPPVPSIIPAPPPAKGLMKKQSISDNFIKYDREELETEVSFELDTDIAFEKTEEYMVEDVCPEDISLEEPGAMLCEPPESEEDLYFEKTQKNDIPISERLNLTLKYLARNQTAEGSWSKYEDLSTRVISTSLGILAFIKEGHTNKAGNYKPQLEKAVYFIKNNMDNLSGLSLALASQVFFELYRLSGKKKEKIDAEKILEKLKVAWKGYVTVREKFFAALAGKSAIKAGLVKEGDFDNIDKWPDEAGKEARELTAIITLDDMFTGFISVILGDEDRGKTFLRLLTDYHIDCGEDSGSIRIQGLHAVMLDVTAIGAFIISAGSER